MFVDDELEPPEEVLLLPGVLEAFGALGLVPGVLGV